MSTSEKLSAMTLTVRQTEKLTACRMEAISRGRPNIDEFTTLRILPVRAGSCWMACTRSSSETSSDLVKRRTSTATVGRDGRLSAARIFSRSVVATWKLLPINRGSYAMRRRTARVFHIRSATALLPSRLAASGR